MEIEDVIRGVEQFKNENEDVLNDFNERIGDFDLKNLIERARETDITRTFIIPWDRDFPIFLAIGDLVEKIIEADIMKTIQNFAEERGWNSSGPEFTGWKNESSKLMNLKDESDLSSYFSFHYQKTISNFINLTGCPLIEIYKDENDEYKSRFYPDRLVIESIGQMDR